MTNTSSYLLFSCDKRTCCDRQFNSTTRNILLEGQ